MYLQQLNVQEPYLLNTQTQILQPASIFICLEVKQCI